MVGEKLALRRIRASLDVYSVSLLLSPALRLEKKRPSWDSILKLITAVERIF
jgi:hypothetical protein